MMFKQLIYKIAKGLLWWAVNWLYDYVDKDNDGKLSKEELQAIYYQTKDFLNK